MSSRATEPAGLAADEANELFWRQNPRRAEAEVLRDTLLTISGALNPKMGGPSVFPTLPSEVHSTQDSAGKGWTDSPPQEQQRRTIYLFVKRALNPPLLDAFDCTTTAAKPGRRRTRRSAGLSPWPCNGPPPTRNWRRRASFSPPTADSPAAARTSTRPVMPCACSASPC